MKLLKITLVLAFVLALFTSCTEQELNNDEDVLVTPTAKRVKNIGGLRYD